MSADRKPAKPGGQDSPQPNIMGPNTKGPNTEGPGTTGHEWDGIQELNNPLPRWWLYIFYASIAFSLLWMVLYPAWPTPGGGTTGVLGYSTRAEIEKELLELTEIRGQALKGIEKVPLADIPRNPQLMQAAVEGGRSAFKVHCIQCHGTGAAGSKGYPNLNDDDWIWGGSMAEIHATLVNGIRYHANENSRQSMMPAFGRDGLLTPAQIADTVEHVRALSRQEHDSTMAGRGALIFAQQCASCHGDGGKGIRSVGSPNLSDAIWLYGGDRATLTETLVNARAGVMPAWNERLSESTIRKLTAYVHSLGGGE
ncbi:MAG: cytochrome-c oxidase, cbb3-type subunit III [Sandaracinobacteroides sp.]